MNISLSWAFKSTDIHFSRVHLMSCRIFIVLPLNTVNVHFFARPVNQSDEGLLPSPTPELICKPQSTHWSWVMPSSTSSLSLPSLPASHLTLKCFCTESNPLTWGASMSSAYNERHHPPVEHQTDLLMGPVDLLQSRMQESFSNNHSSKNNASHLFLHTPTFIHIHDCK